MTTVITGLCWLALALCAVLAALAALRFFSLHSRGTVALVRSLPAKDTYSWRHGILRYSDEELKFFKLRSLWPRADLVFDRLDVELLGTRSLDDVEASFMPEAGDVVTLRSGCRQYEIATGGHGVMGLRAWVESAPSKRKEKVDFERMRHRAVRGPKQ